MNRSKETLALAVFTAACMAFAVASVGMSFEAEPFFTWYYSFAWWSFILAAESFLFLRGGYAVLYEAPRRFLLMLPVSVTLWCLFEAYNFRLGNWHYLNLPAHAGWRWAGYALGFATVLPALASVRRIFEFLGLWEDRRVEPLRRAHRLHRPFVLAGLLMLALPLIWPRFFFPLVWGGFLFLLEPWLHGRSLRSLLTLWERGSPRLFFLLLLSGLACGLLWEAWNFHAGAKWYYTVPFVGEWRLFEMPLPGFLGFPIFAVQCHAMWAAFLVLRERLGGLRAVRRRLAWAALGLAALGFDLAVFALMDRFTVDSLAKAAF